MKKVITLLLSIVLVFGVITPTAFATADNDIMHPRYSRIYSIVTDLDIDSSGKSTCNCKVRSGTATDTVDLTMELQRLENGNWNTIKTWTSSGTRLAYLAKNWYVLSGYDYQLRITAEVYDSDGNLMETQVDYSKTVSY